MRTAKEYIDLISAHADELRSQFGIRSLRLFGSVSRGEQREDSDVDICVDMEPSLYLLVRLKRFLEQLLQCSVDVVNDNVKVYQKIIQKYTISTELYLTADS
jgi:predicted nucleotidyltransferase